MSDFGPRTAFKVVDGIRDKVLAGKLKTGDQIRSELKAAITALLITRGGSTELALPAEHPAVLLVVGVNGGGKTTTIGKLAHRFGSEGGARVVLAAGDTFRAAAAEQLEEWARRAGAEIVRAESDKTRPDTVLYQAVDSAVRSGADLVLCDTSGRLHTNWSLMDELAKCKRSIAKRLSGAPHEVTSWGRTVLFLASEVAHLAVPCARVTPGSSLDVSAESLSRPCCFAGAAGAGWHHWPQHAQPSQGVQ
jgi:fused signal recognition particle receptor